MAHYLIRRSLFLIPMVFVISAVVFWAIRMIPVDPAELVVGPYASADQRELARQKLGLTSRSSCSTPSASRTRSRVVSAVRSAPARR